MFNNWNLSLQRKLQVIIMTTVGAALVLACATFLTYDLIAFKRSMQRDLKTGGEIVGSNSMAALTFGDQNAALDLLSGLKAKPHILNACIYSADGKPFACYQRAGLRSVFVAPPVEVGGSRFTSDR